MDTIDLDTTIENLVPARRVLVQSIIDVVTALYPQADKSMKYKMPTFEVNGGWVAVANQKHYVSVYTCSAQHIVVFKGKYPQIKTGKGCINFKEKDDFNLEDLEQVIHSALSSGQH